jgi:hypothetical protein
MLHVELWTNHSHDMLYGTINLHCTPASIATNVVNVI